MSNVKKVVDGLVAEAKAEVERIAEHQVVLEDGKDNGKRRPVHADQKSAIAADVVNHSAGALQEAVIADVQASL